MSTTDTHGAADRETRLRTRIDTLSDERDALSFELEAGRYDVERARTATRRAEAESKRLEALDATERMRTERESRLLERERGLIVETDRLSRELLAQRALAGFAGRCCYCGAHAYGRLCRAERCREAYAGDPNFNELALRPSAGRPGEQVVTGSAGSGVDRGEPVAEQCPPNTLTIAGASPAGRGVLTTASSARGELDPPPSLPSLTDEEAKS